MGGRSEIGVELGDEGHHEVEEEKGFAQPEGGGVTGRKRRDLFASVV